MKWFKEFPINNQNYKINKLFIYLIALVVLGLAFYSFSYDNFSGSEHYYSECPLTERNESCFNSFYNSNLCGKIIESTNELCTTNEMYAGQTIGQKPPFIITNFIQIFLIIIVTSLILNHTIYNKDFQFGEIQ